VNYFILALFRIYIISVETVKIPIPKEILKKARDAGVDMKQILNAARDFMILELSIFFFS